jgi:prepilin-type N-terminal cleavage/methylation domain-containing protein
MSRPVLQSRRAGFSLTEVVMAVVILGIILVSLAGLTFRTAQRSVQLDAIEVTAQRPGGSPIVVSEPEITWHTARDNWSELMSWLAMLTATLAKIAAEIAKITGLPFETAPNKVSATAKRNF